MRSMKRGFTLVEILIVVIILGILAAVVIPQFSQASSDTRQSSVMQNLQIIRTQIQFYKANHPDAFPIDFADQMEHYTDLAGNTNATASPVFLYGPYLMTIPKNPYTNQETITRVTGTGTAYTPAADMNQGWWYNSDTGEFRCHLPDTVLTSEGTPANQL